MIFRMENADREPSHDEILILILIVLSYAIGRMLTPLVYGIDRACLPFPIIEYC